MDVEAARRFALRVWQIKQGEVLALTVHLGHRLGLYRAMAGRGPLTPAEVAAAAEVDERWTREWLRAQAAADLLEHHDGRFTLSDVATAVLADEQRSPFFAAGVFEPGDPAAAADRIATAFRTGTGFDYEDGGEHVADLITAMNGPWARLLLPHHVLPQLPDLHERLQDGVRVVDVGCGTGDALVAMARAHPASSFLGLDLSPTAVARARDATDDLDNVTVVQGTTAVLDDAEADVVTMFDVLHDLAHPDRALREVRGALRDDGHLLVKDIRTAPTFEEQQRNPVLAMMYGLSLLSCLPSGLGPDGEGMGLGNQGLPPQRMEELATAAGFETVEVHDLDDPVNLYYLVR